MKCGAKAKSTGKSCQREAMTNGRCYVHGGATPAGDQSPHYKHGRYSKHLKQRLQAKADVFKDGDALDIFDELALQRALFVDFAARFEDGVSMSLFDIQAMMAMLTDIMRSAERIQKMRNDTALTGAEIALLQTRAVDVAMKYFDDPETRRRFLKDLFGLDSNPAGGAERLELVGNTGSAGSE